MDQAYTSQTKDRVIKELNETIEDLSSRLCDGQIKQQCLSYKITLVKKLYYDASTGIETDEWDMERHMLKTQKEIATQESLAIKEDLIKYKKIQEMALQDTPI